MIRYLPELRALQIGEDAGPLLQLLPGPGGLPFGPDPATLRRALEDLARAVGKEPLALVPRSDLSRAFPTPLRQWGVGAGGRYVLRLAWPPAMKPLDALYAVEGQAASEEGRGLPALLIAPFVWLARRLPDPYAAPPQDQAMAALSMQALAFMVHRHVGGRTGRLRPMDREALRRRQLARLWAAADEERALEILGDVPASGVEAALLALELGLALWDPDEIPEGAPGPGGFWAAWHLARLSEGEGRGIMPWPVRDWALWFDLVRARRAGRPLPPRDWPPPQAALLRGWPHPGERAADPELARGLFRALMATAEREGRYAPAGRFRVLAPDLPLFRRLGVRAIRIAADPRGLWVRPVGEEGEGEIFRLDVELPPRPDLLEDPAWLAAAAALWHDLRVGVPRAPRRREGGGEEAAPAEEGGPKGGEGRGERPVALPRPFAIREPPGSSIGLPGQPDKEPEAEWGEAAERARLVRAAHAVRGHLRRLPPGRQPSEEAREIAASFGVVVPEGFTFVRPHVRGGRKEGEGEGAGVTPEREAVARGLRSLALLDR